MHNSEHMTKDGVYVIAGILLIGCWLGMRVNFVMLSIVLHRDNAESFLIGDLIILEL